MKIHIYKYVHICIWKNWNWFANSFSKYLLFNWGKIEKREESLQVKRFYFYFFTGQGMPNGVNVVSVAPIEVPNGKWSCRLLSISTSKKNLFVQTCNYLLI